MKLQDDWNRQQVLDAFQEHSLRVGDDPFDDFEAWERDVGTADELLERMLLSDGRWVRRMSTPFELMQFIGRTGGTIVYAPTEALPTDVAGIIERAYAALLPHAADWFPGGGKFEPVPLAAHVADELSLTRGPGGGLWYDAGGVYRSGGEDLVGALVRSLLRDEFRKNRLSEVLGWCSTLPQDVSAATNPDVLNVANGVLDLDTLELRPARDGERFTYQIPFAWNPRASCPGIEAFVREVVPPDCVALVAEAFGMALMQTGRYRRAVMLIGTSGSNGKSVLLALLRELLGDDNVSSVTLQAITTDRFAKAQLFGKLANIAGDLDEEAIASSGMFKTLTGGVDTVTADHKFGQPFQFVNHATLVFSANAWPVVLDHSESYFKRWIAIPFHRQYVEDGSELGPGQLRADPLLTDKLTARSEMEGLLVRAVHGARRLRERGGFDVPVTVRESVQDYREHADSVLAWLSDRDPQPLDGHRMPRTLVYGNYVDWCAANTRKPMSSKKFWPGFRTSMKERGLEADEVKYGGERMIAGVTWTG